VPCCRETALPEVNFDIVPAALGDEAPCGVQWRWLMTWLTEGDRRSTRVILDTDDRARCLSWTPENYTSICG